MTFKDHFSVAASGYAAHRPVYPRAVAEALAARSPGRSVVWDAGCGSGQLSVVLAAAFDQVVATDASAAQIAEAVPHVRVRYAVAPAEVSGLPDDSVSCAVAAQAAHWFDLDAFYREVARVLKPDGVLALWCYGILTIAPGIDAILHRFEHERVGPWWPAERRHVDSEYRTLPFPYARIDAPVFVMEARLTRPALLGYLGSWSAVSRCRAATGEDPLGPLDAELAPLWSAAESKLVRWPLTVVAGRAPASTPHA